MMKRQIRQFSSLFVAFLLVFPIFSTYSEILSCHTPSEFCALFEEESLYQQDTLLIFDIDDTLIVSNNPVLRSSSLDTLINIISDTLSISQKEAFHLIEVWAAKTSQRLGSGELVFSELTHLIEKCQKKGVTSLALTQVDVNLNVEVSPLEPVDRRVEDLSCLGISFSHTDNKTVPLFHPSLSPPLPQMKQGVILTGPHNKGRVILALLRHLPFHPQRIFFFDDRRENLESVENQLVNTDIHFTGVHFDYVMKNLCPIDLSSVQQTAQEIISWQTGSAM